MQLTEKTGLLILAEMKKLSASYEQTGQLILRELRILNAGVGKTKQKASWKTACEIKRLTVWKNFKDLDYARKHDLVRYEVVRATQQRSEKIKPGTIYRYDYNSIAPEYFTPYQQKIS